MAKGLIALRTVDKDLCNWAQLINEHLEVWSGSRGDPSSRIVRQSELKPVQSTPFTKQDDIFTIAQKLAAMPQFVSTVAGVQAKFMNIPALRSDFDALSRRINSGTAIGLVTRFSCDEDWFILPVMGLSYLPDVKEFQTTVGDAVDIVGKAFKLINLVKDGGDGEEVRQEFLVFDEVSMKQSEGMYLTVGPAVYGLDTGADLWIEAMDAMFIQLEKTLTEMGTRAFAAATALTSAAGRYQTAKINMQIAQQELADAIADWQARYAAAHPPT